jgi:hypothetical protein
MRDYNESRFSGSSVIRFREKAGNAAANSQVIHFVASGNDIAQDTMLMFPG